VRRNALPVLLVALWAGLAFAQAPAPTPAATLRGSWWAAVGRHKSFQGHWSAKITTDNPDAAAGTWTLLGPDGRIAMQGRWAAQKAAKAWNGTWTADAGGTVLSGTWEAQAKSAAGNTFEDMLRGAAKSVVTGSWRAGRVRGLWRLAN
jgi:hypothetical protein